MFTYFVEDQSTIWKVRAKWSQGNAQSFQRGLTFIACVLAMVRTKDWSKGRYNFITLFSSDCAVFMITCCRRVAPFQTSAKKFNNTCAKFHFSHQFLMTFNAMGKRACGLDLVKSVTLKWNNKISACLSLNGKLNWEIGRLCQIY